MDVIRVFDTLVEEYLLRYFFVYRESYLKYVNNKKI